VRVSTLAFPKLLTALLAFALALSVLVYAEICKWVDEKGVTHYAAECPEKVDAQEVEIQKGPTEQEIEQAQKRSQQLLDKRAARRELEKQEKEQKALAEQALLKEQEHKEAICVDAARNNFLLRYSLPVYFDENNELHCDRSLHHYWYEGERVYLSDKERQAEMKRYTELINNYCDNELHCYKALNDYFHGGERVYRNNEERQAEMKRRYTEIVNDHCEGDQLTPALGRLLTITYINSPKTGYTMQMLQNTELIPSDDACNYARFLLNDFRKNVTGIPTTEMRELDEMINKQCK